MRIAIAVVLCAAGMANAQDHKMVKADVDRWMTELSNWGRWGKDDELGALNLITGEKRKQAAALAKTGITVSLSRQIDRSQPSPSAGPRPVNRAGALTNLFLIDGDYLF